MTNITQVPVNIGPKPRVVRLDDNGLVGSAIFGIFIYVWLLSLRSGRNKL